MGFQNRPEIQSAFALFNDPRYANELTQFQRACVLGRSDDIVQSHYAIEAKLAEIAPDDPAARDAHFCKCLKAKSDLRHVPITPADDHETLAEVDFFLNLLIFGHFGRMMGERDLGIYTVDQLNETSAWAINNFVEGFGAFDEMVPDTATTEEIELNFIKRMMVLAGHLIDNLDQATSQANSLG